MSDYDPNDILFGKAVPSAKFKSLGDSVSGTIVKVEASQRTKYQQDETAPKVLEWWPDGRPIMQVVVTLQTTGRDPFIPDDDGKRRVFIKGPRLEKAVRDAVRAAGANRLDEGGTLTVTFVSEEKSGAASPAKVYAATYAKPSGAAAAAAVLSTESIVSPPMASVPGIDQLLGRDVSPEVQAKLAQLLAAQTGGQA